MVNRFQLIEYLLAVTCGNIGEHITYLCVSYQELAYNIDIMSCQNAIYLRQYTRYVGMDVY